MKKKESKFDFNNKTITLLIVSIALILFSYWPFLAELGGGWFFLAGILLLIVTIYLGDKSFFKTNWNTIKVSFKHMKSNILFMIICDIFLFLLLFGMVFSGIEILKSKASGLPQDMNFQELAAQGDEQALQELNEILSSFKSFLFTVIGLLVLMVIATIIFYTVFKGIAWNLAFSHFPNIRSIGRFFVVNIIWIPLTILLTVYLSFTLRAEFAAKALVILWALTFHMTIVLNAVFALKGKTFKSFHIMLKTAFMSLRYFIIPYIILVLLFLLVIPISTLFMIFSPMIQAAVTFLILLPLVLAVTRIYIGEVVKEHMCE